MTLTGIKAINRDTFEFRGNTFTRDTASDRKVAGFSPRGVWDQFICSDGKTYRIYKADVMDASIDAFNIMYR